MTPKSPDIVRTALYAGSFNPFTTGHLSILRRGLELFDRVVVVIGINESNPGGRQSADGLADRLREKLQAGDRVEVMTWDGLTVDAAEKVGARWLLRGVRSVADYEYERNLADINRAISGLDTVILFAEPELSMVSSSMVRELTRYGRDVADFVV